MMEYQDQRSEVKQIKYIIGKELVERITFQGKQVSRRKKLKKIMKHYKNGGTGIFKLWERKEELRGFMTWSFWVLQLREMDF